MRLENWRGVGGGMRTSEASDTRAAFGLTMAFTYTSRGLELPSDPNRKKATEF